MQLAPKHLHLATWNSAQGLQIGQQIIPHKSKREHTSRSQTRITISYPSKEGRFNIDVSSKKITLKSYESRSAIKSTSEAAIEHVDSKKWCRTVMGNTFRARDDMKEIAYLNCVSQFVWDWCTNAEIKTNSFLIWRTHNSNDTQSYCSLYIFIFDGKCYDYTKDTKPMKFSN